MYIKPQTAFWDMLIGKYRDKEAAAIEAAQQAIFWKLTISGDKNSFTNYILDCEDIFRKIEFYLLESCSQEEAKDMIEKIKKLVPDQGSITCKISDKTSLTIAKMTSGSVLKNFQPNE